MLRSDHGIEGDAHAGSGHRQVSLLDLADVGEMQQRGLVVAEGAFGENLGVRDLPFAAIGLGSRRGSTR